MSIQDLAKALINPYVLIYIFIIISTQILFWYLSLYKKKKITKRRQEEGLPSDIIMNHSERLADIRRESIYESSILLLTIILVPFAIVGGIYMFGYLTTKPDSAIRSFSKIITDEGKGLVIIFIGLLIWLLFSATDVARGFLGGLGFKTLAAFKQPFQVGDRVTLKGYSGKVTSISTFFVKLQTVDDDLISIPTSSLWSEVLTSSNAGERSSLCVMNFYLAPFVTNQNRQKAEDVIWDAMQASTYLEISKPMQIYISQESNSIILTAKAYVASTYNEPLFKSDVTRAFLDFAEKKHIPLSSPAWKEDVKKVNEVTKV
jgi:small-conductance mechanosensitive channel